MAFCMSSYCTVPLLGYQHFCGYIQRYPVLHTVSVHEGTVMDLYPVPVRLYSRTFFVEGQTALFRHTFSFSIGSYPVSEYYSLYGLDIFAGDYLHAPVHSLGAGRICNGNRSGMADV